MASFLKYSFHMNISYTFGKKLLFLIITGIFLSNCSANIEEINWETVTPSGTEPRIEREYKYTLEIPENTDIKKIAEEIRTALEENLKTEEWNIEKKLLEKSPLDKRDLGDFKKTTYSIDSLTKEYLYRDIYSDTPEFSLLKNNLQYRLRHRFKGAESYERYLENIQSLKYGPYRMEFQAKTDRKNLGEGFSEVSESRFEFREESSPFSPNNPPPEKPWDLRKYLHAFHTGIYQKYYTWPAKSIANTLGKNKLPKLEEKVLILTQRERMHLNIKTPWGSGPNPEQAFIISIDHVKVFSKEYVSYLLGKNSKPKKSGEFYEIEVEFERNTSEKLDQEITNVETISKHSEQKYLKSIRNSFLQDQKKIMETVQNYFASQNIKVIPGEKNKYERAMEFLK